MFREQMPEIRADSAEKASRFLEKKWSGISSYQKTAIYQPLGSVLV
jgi:hypothetical protein